MDVIQAIVIGLVQGITEFLPISSTAHVRVVPALVGWNDPGAAFTAVIQLGSLLAILIYFREDLQRAVNGWAKSVREPELRKTHDARLGWAVFYGTIPVVILGYFLRDYIEGAFRSLYVIAFSLIGLAMLLAFAEYVAKRNRYLDSVRVRDGWIVGLFQALALVPGVSRSGSTITGALFLGFDRPTAARFSFLLSVPAILLAGVYGVYAERENIMQGDSMIILAATIAAFISSYVAIDFLLKFLRRHSTYVFIGYRIALGVTLLLLLAGGRLHPLQ